MTTRAQAWREEQERMINLTPDNPPPASEPRIAVSELLELLDNAPAAKEHLAKIATAHEQARKQLEREKLRIESEHKDHLDSLTQEHNEALARDRGVLAKERAEFGKERQAVLAEIEAARKTLAADRETVDALKADARRRLERISAAATETV
jgi:hypothetical protein